MKNTSKGLFLGLLAAGAVVGYMMTKGSGKTKKQLQKDFGMLAKQLQSVLGGLKNVTKERFDEVVQELVEQNAQRLKLASAAKKNLIAALQEIWQNMEEEEVAPVRTVKKTSVRAAGKKRS